MSHDESNNNETIHLQLNISIQIASDLHIEFYESSERIPSDIIQRRAPILALLGDIGLACTELLRMFLHQQADRFEHVLFLPGNHEFYNNSDDDDDDRNCNKKNYSVQDQLAWMRHVCQERPNLHFMEKQAVEIDGVLILGTMLWSQIPQNMTEIAEECMNDFQLSFVTTEENRLVPMTAAFTNEWHKKSVQWLQEQIRQAKARSQPVVVLTHHTPSLEGTSHPMYKGDDLSCCFSTDLTICYKIQSGCGPVVTRTTILTGLWRLLEWFPISGAILVKRMWTMTVKVLSFESRVRQRPRKSKASFPLMVTRYIRL